MLQSFVITLREGIEAALATAIILAYLRRIGRGDLSISVYWGLAAALVSSVVGAILSSRLKVNTDTSEGYFMLVGSILVASLVYLMLRTAKGMKGEIEQKLERMVGEGNPRAALAVFLFVFVMVGREGAETILFLSAVSLNTSALLNFAGGVLGLAAAVVFGVLFTRGSVRVNLRQFFRFTTAILFLVSVQLLISGLHELSEARVLPSSTREMAVIGPIVNNDAYFFVAMLVLCGLLFLRGRIPPPTPQADEVGRAAFRLKLAEYRRQQRVRIAGGLASLALSAALAVDLAIEHALAEPPRSAAVSLQGDAVKIPTSELRDGNVHFYRVDIGGKSIPFLAVRSEPGKYETAFNACGICMTTYFYQSGQNIICANCGAALPLASIGEPGGCNPVPLPSTASDAYVNIRQEELLKLNHGRN